MVLMLEYSGRTRPISLLLMPWLPALPDHQQTLHGLHMMNRSLYFVWKLFNYLCHLSVEGWQKVSVNTYVLSTKFSTPKVKRVYHKRIDVPSDVVLSHTLFSIWSLAVGLRRWTWAAVISGSPPLQMYWEGSLVSTTTNFTHKSTSCTCKMST